MIDGRPAIWIRAPRQFVPTVGSLLLLGSGLLIAATSLQNWTPSIDSPADPYTRFLFTGLMIAASTTYLAWTLIGREELAVDGEVVTLVARLGPLRWRRDFTLLEQARLRPVGVLREERTWNRVIDRLAPGMVFIEHREGRARVGLALRDSEATAVAEALRRMQAAR